MTHLLPCKEEVSTDRRFYDAGRARPRSARDEGGRAPARLQLTGSFHSEEDEKKPNAQGRPGSAGSDRGGSNPTAWTRSESPSPCAYMFVVCLFMCALCLQTDRASTPSLWARRSSRLRRPQPLQVMGDRGGERSSGRGTNTSLIRPERERHKCSEPLQTQVHNWVGFQTSMSHRDTHLTLVKSATLSNAQKKNLINFYFSCTFSLIFLVFADSSVLKYGGPEGQI